MLDQDDLEWLRIDALKTVDSIRCFCSFSKYHDPSWTSKSPMARPPEGRSERGIQRFLQKFETSYLDAFNQTRMFLGSFSEEHELQIAVSNGYHNSLFFGWQNHCRTAHSVVSSLYGLMDFVTARLPPGWLGENEQVDDVTNMISSCIRGFMAEELKAEINEESIRAKLAVGSGGIVASRIPHRMEFWEFGVTIAFPVTNTVPKDPEPLTDTIQENESQKTPKERFLGLVVDEKHGISIQRDGFRATVHLEPGSAEMHTFLVAWSSKGNGATKEQWENGYPGERRPELMRNVKSRLNEKLAVLNVKLAPNIPPKLIPTK